ncbi:MAG: nicotinate (nicotinamide) nucleotide adenylyltransferase [Candidatus Sumerlaeia bacterium]
MKKTFGIFGGTFDPPHVGHVMAVDFVLLTSELDRVFVIPCANHPFGKNHEPFEHRMDMCHRAFSHLGEQVEILDIEGRRHGPSYTVDTVRELRERYPDADFVLIVGSDIRDELDQWKEVDELKKMVTIRMLPRLEENTSEKESDQDSPFYLPRVSSSSLRRMLARGEMEKLGTRLPHTVIDYIQEHNLYT